VIAVVVGLTVANATAARPSALGAGSASDGMPGVYLTINGLPGHGGAIVHDSRTGGALVSVKEPYLKGTVPVVATIKRGPVSKFIVIRSSSVSGKPTAEMQSLTFLHGELTTATVFLGLGGPSVQVEGLVRCQGTTAFALGIPRPGGGLSPKIVLAPGAQTWSAPGTTATVSDLSCAGKNKLGFLLTDSKTTRGQVRELNLSAPGHNLLASRIVARSGGTKGTILSGFATSRGAPIIATMFTEGRRHGHNQATIRLAAISPRTGRIIKVFETFIEIRRSGSGLLAAKRDCQVSSVDPTGHHALVNCGGLHRLDNGTLTNLRNKSGKFGHQIVAATW
jgi:hypothetical protein